MQVKTKSLILPARKIVLPNDRRKLPRPAPWVWVPKRIVPARGAVANDATGTLQVKSTAGLSQTYTGLTIGTGLTNPAAAFICVMGQATGGVAGTVTATWNGVACSNIRQQDTATVCSVILFGITNPASGPKNFIVSTTNSCAGYIIGCSYSGVDQTGGTTSFPHSNVNSSGSSTSTQIVITTANGNATICGGAMGNATNGLTPGNLFADSTLDGTAGYSGAGAQSLSTTSSTTYTGTNGSADFINLVGMDILAAAATAATFSSTLSLMGVG